VCNKVTYNAVIGGQVDNPWHVMPPKMSPNPLQKFRLCAGTKVNRNFNRTTWSITFCVREQSSKIVRKKEVRNLVRKPLNKRNKENSSVLRSVRRTEGLVTKITIVSSAN